MSTPHSKYTYSKCLARSKKAAWDLNYFNNIVLNFDKPFLPEALAQTHAIDSLNKQDRLRLNQIRGYTYAYLFRFVEEYIIGLVEELHVEHKDEEAQEAMRTFLDEEKKHQELFRLFEQRFQEGFPTPCQTVGNMQVIAETILSHSRLSVLLLTAMFEWLTQAHYLAYFDERGHALEIDDAFKELFRLHWVEEAQHARLDEIEVLRAANLLSQAERKSAILEFLDICNDFFDILKSQAQLDIQSLKLASGENHSLELDKEIVEKQCSAYFHTFIRLGLLNRHFRKLLETISPTSYYQINFYLQDHLDA